MVVKPTGSVVVEIAGMVVPFSVIVPNAVVPAVNVTVPVGGAPVEDVTVTVREQCGWLRL